MSEFLLSGKLPKVCIHTPLGDQYSKYYEPEKKCKCNCDNWIDGEMDIIKSIEGFNFPPKKVHRCKNCNAVRVAHMIEVQDEQ
jgi:hypothetical protein